MHALEIQVVLWSRLRRTVEYQGKCSLYNSVIPLYIEQHY